MTFTPRHALTMLALAALGTPTVAAAQAPPAPAAPAPAAAQAPPAPAAPAPAAQPVGPAPIEAMRVTVWPEYDRPTALVLLQGQLAADIPVPATIQVAIPAAAVRPHAVAYRGADGRLINAQHQVGAPAQGWVPVAVTTDAPQFQLEYYLPIAKDGEARRFALDWGRGTAVGTLTYRVQQPAGATGLTVQPPASAKSAGRDGLTYHDGTLDAGKRPTLLLQYRKADDRLTIETLRPAAPAAGMPPAGGQQAGGAAPGGSGSAPAPAPKSEGTPMLWIGIFIGLAVAAAGWTVLSSRKSGTKSS